MIRYIVVFLLLNAQSVHSESYIGVRLGSVEKLSDACYIDSCLDKKPHVGLFTGYSIEDGFNLEVGLDYLNEIYGDEGTYSVNLMPGYKVDLTDKLAIDVKAGISKVFNKGDGGISPVYAGRVRYDINDNIGLFYEFKHLDGGESTLLHGLGFTYSFSQKETVLLDSYPIQRSSIIPAQTEDVDIVGDDVALSEDVKLLTVLFDFDSAKLNNDTVIDDLDESISEFNYQIITISGHTDDAGSDFYNTNLSKIRVLTVKDYLISKGVNSESIKTEYHGSKHPLFPNDSPENRAKNRRVEIEFH